MNKPIFDTVKLVVNGNTFTGWQEITITDAVTQAAAAFELSVTERWQLPKPAVQQLGQWKIRAGDKCQVYIGSDLFLTGFVDVHRPTISSTDHNVSVSGRSLTGDLVDCSAVHDPGNWKGQSIMTIAESLAKPFGITVKAGDGVSALPTIEKFELNNGETVHQAIERLARKHQLLVTADAQGALVLTRAGTSAYDFLLEGWEQASVTADMSKRFSTYTGKGQQHGQTKADPLEAARVTASATDSGVKRYRPMIIRPEGATKPDEAQKRVDWQLNRNIGEGLKMECTMTGFRTPTGKLWTKNMKVRVKDEVLDVDAELLIESVKFAKSNQGTTTALTLVMPGAYDPEPLTSEDKATGEAKPKGKRKAAKAEAAKEETGSTDGGYFDP